MPDKKSQQQKFQAWLLEQLEPKQSYKDNPDYVDVWFLLPTGLICGKFDLILADDVVTLIDAYISMGNKSAKVKQATISAAQVIAWGTGVPTFIEEQQAVLV